MIKVEFTTLRKKVKCRRGFTLIETLIAVMLVIILGFVSAGMVTFFAKYTRRDMLKTCLLQAASSGIEAKRANPGFNFITISCSGYTANVDIISSGTYPATAPAIGAGISACVKITSIATIEGEKMELKDFICNFPEG